jgi:hypothetical protein
LKSWYQTKWLKNIPELESDPALFSFALEDVSLYFILRYHLEKYIAQEFHNAKLAQPFQIRHKENH